MGEESSCHREVVSLVARLSWSSFLSSIRSDLTEIKSSVTEGAAELYGFVKDSVPEGKGISFYFLQRY